MSILVGLGVLFMFLAGIGFVSHITITVDGPALVMPAPIRFTACLVGAIGLILVLIGAQ